MPGEETTWRLKVSRAASRLRKYWVGGVEQAGLEAAQPTQFDVARYWTAHNVTSHHEFGSIGNSLEYLHWRNDQYFDYIKLMPLDRLDGKTVLDFGCGPGHDLVGFGSFSKPARLVGVDLSSVSLGQASRRVALHGIKTDL